MDFSQVTDITIPEGQVTKIQDGNGNVLWEKGPTWVTIWEGNTRFGYGGTTSGTTLSSSLSYVDGLKFRVTFSGMTGSIEQYASGSVTYTPSDRISPYTTSTIPNSPYANNMLLRVTAQNTSRNTTYDVWLDYTIYNSRLYVNVIKSSNTNYAQASFYLKKVEALM